MKEFDTIYVDDDNRYIVSLIVGYGEAEIDEETSLTRATSELTALAGALDLTRDDASRGTRWYVFDRVTGKGRFYDQSEFEK